MSYVYIRPYYVTTDSMGEEKKIYDSCLTVGFYNPDGTWEPESDHDTEESASARVAYLNQQNLEV